MAEGTDASQSQDIPVSICSADYMPAVRLILRQIPSDGGTQCLRGFPVTRDCALACTPDLALGGGTSCGKARCLERADCVVYEQIGSLDQTSVLARCPTALFNDPMNAKCGASCPCWRLVARRWCSPSINGSPISLEVLRDRPAPRGAIAVVKCETTTHAAGSPGLQALPRCDPAR